MAYSLNNFLFSSVSVLFPVIPMLWLVISLGLLKMPAYKACGIGLVLSLFIAVNAWKMDCLLAVKAAMEGVVFAFFPIIWVIIAAFFAYNVSLSTGAMERMKRLMAGISGDRRIQALIIAWGFGGFLESVAGFGTAVAVPASILIALGFEPFLAAVTCLLANTIAVAFGVVGIPITTLAQITEIPVMMLSRDIVFQLTPFVFAIPLLIVFTITRQLNGIKGIWLITFVAGISFGISQMVIALYVGPELPAIIGSLVSFGAMVLCVKLFPPSQEWKFPHEYTETILENQVEAIRLKDQLVAWSPYVLLLVFVLGSSNLFPAIHSWLGQVRSAFYIYNGVGGKPLYIDWILTPGTLVLLSAIIGGLIQKASARQLIQVFGETINQLRKTSVSIISIVSMAKVLGYSGMIGSLAVTLASTTGSYYSIFAPMIGVLGTFITGSDTSANILFGLLQKQTAIQLGMNPVWVAAANTSGACVGKLISPQNIVIAATASGLSGKEGELLAATFKYVVALLIGLSLIVCLFAFKS